MRGTRGGLLALVVGLVALAPLGGNGTAAAGPNALLLAPIANVSNPTFVTASPGDPHRVFVVQQTGQIALIKDNVLQGTPFMPVPNVLYDGNARGLFSLAVAPLTEL